MKNDIDLVEDLCLDYLDYLKDYSSMDESFKDLVQRYPDFTIMDIVSICKIDRLMELGIISKKTHDALKEIYVIGVDLLQNQLEYAGYDEEESNKIFNKIDIIKQELDKYGVAFGNIKLRDYLDDMIATDSWYRMDEQNVHKLLHELKNDKNN